MISKEDVQRTRSFCRAGGGGGGPLTHAGDREMRQLWRTGQGPRGWGESLSLQRHLWMIPMLRSALLQEGLER